MAFAMLQAVDRRIGKNSYEAMGMILVLPTLHCSSVIPRKAKEQCTGMTFMSYPIGELWTAWERYSSPSTAFANRIA